jgi:DNA-directed RNA polymerase subunit K/omega
MEPDGGLDRSDDEEDVKARRADEDDDNDEEDEVDDVVDSDDDVDSEDDEEEDSVAAAAEEDGAAAADEEETTTIQQQQKQRLGFIDGDDDTDAVDDSLKKYDPSLRFSMMEQYHPELLMENNVDVINKTVIQRKEDGTISDPHHRTMPLLTKYEKARILGERARQLNAGAKAMVDVPDHVSDGYLIAMQEFEAKKIPFIIKRPLHNGHCEYWKFCDLECL